jgi:hypothetical protein
MRESRGFEHSAALWYEPGWPVLNGQPATDGSHRSIGYSRRTGRGHDIGRWLSDGCRHTVHRPAFTLLSGSRHSDLNYGPLAMCEHHVEGARTYLVLLHAWRAAGLATASWALISSLALFAHLSTSGAAGLGGTSGLCCERAVALAAVILAPGTTARRSRVALPPPRPVRLA